MNPTKRQQDTLQRAMQGDVFFDETMRRLYATDASVYRELPLAVALPKTVEDIQLLVHFAKSIQSSLIPRAAGTSLAGQCVGGGIVVDISKYFTQIIELNEAEQWVRVQPGVIRDDLNKYLKPYNLLFGPNTSTSNRAMIGGMVGNNSCGSYSIVYGDTRRHVLELKCVLSDGTEAFFGEVSPDTFRQKCIGNRIENQVYRQINFELSNPATRSEIAEHFPDAAVSRRNTGYALDELMACTPFASEGAAFNFCKLLAGSEGTLAIVTEIKLHLDPLPPKEQVLLCGHFDSIDSALQAAVVVMQHHTPRAVELMDKIILDCTKSNREHQKNRFFVEGDPQAILAVEFAADTRAEADVLVQSLISEWQQHKLGYAFPIVYPPHINKVWDLRAAGLGLLSNIAGDAKPVAVVEDTAVAIQDLPAYIAEFEKLMQHYGQRSVYYAHAGAGELHLRPILNLKEANDVRLFRQIAQSSAELVKRFNGSLSGEHGDGRVRGEFIPLMVGQKNYDLFRRIKKTWDPDNIFNPGKITDTPPMDTFLRYETGQETPTMPYTMFDFSDEGGMLRAVEKCNGSGDCRKSHLNGGTMCPSYMATRNEKDTTRARANILREILTANDKSRAGDMFDSAAIKEVLDLCLSCKGCTAECPSNIDMTKLKAEFTYQYHKKHGVSLRSRMIANIGRLNALAAYWPSAYNFMSQGGVLSRMGKKYLGIAAARSLPRLHKTTLRHWYNKHHKKLAEQYAAKNGTVYLFCDEFSNYNDTAIGIKTIELLYRLGYDVQMPPHAESGRAYLSKGMLDEARELAVKNVEDFHRLLFQEGNTPKFIIGIEPSAILGFRDEYPRLVPSALRPRAEQIAPYAVLVEEFLYAEAEAGRITSSQFKQDRQRVLLHGHCHQKALSSVAMSAFILSLPQNYAVEVLPTGCCGMAGSFGYEAEHYDLSMQIGELVLFPALRKAANKACIIAASGTSCRHQISDGTGRHALHPVEILWEALIK